jgi:predicted ABC-type ATPase
LAPFKPEDAAAKGMRLMAEAMHACVRERRDFAIESTLAGRSYAGLIREWQSIGYVVKIVYLRLASVEVAVKRVRARVAQGGHDVENEVVRRRFERGWENFQRIYRPLVDIWLVYDANGPRPILIDQGERK